MVVINDEFGIVRRGVVAMLSSRRMQLVHSHLAWLFRCFGSVSLVVVILAIVVAMMFEPLARSVPRVVATVVELLLESLVQLMLFDLELDIIVRFEGHVGFFLLDWNAFFNLLMRDLFNLNHMIFKRS